MPILRQGWRLCRPSSPLSRDCPPDRTPFSSRVIHSWFGRHTRAAQKLREGSDLQVEPTDLSRSAGPVIIPKPPGKNSSIPHLCGSRFLLAIIILYARGIQTSTARGFQIFSKNRQRFNLTNFINYWSTYMYI